jgi:predicted Zn-dependent peptidase
MAFEFCQRTLPNGLSILAECDPSAHTSAVGFFVRAGARDESLADMGVSHFLEHMMFKGTARRSADDVNREFDEMGASYNAYTSHENTVYYARVLPEYLWRSVDLLCDMLRPALREEDFTVEKKVILEEIGMYNDRPQWRLQDALLEHYFGEHPLGYRVLGTVQSITDLPVSRMRAYFQHHYSPDNITVAAAGRVDFDRLVDELSRLTATWTPSGAARKYDAPLPVERAVSLVDAKLNRHHVAMLCPGPGAQDPRRYAARVLADVLGDSEGSRLYWALVDKGLADEAEFSFMPQDRVGCFLAYASCDVDRAEQVQQTLLSTIDHFVQDIDPAEIARAKNKVATQATLQGESPTGRMRNLGSSWTYLREYLPLDVELSRLMAVTIDDIRTLWRDLPPTPRTIVKLGPR